MAIDLRPNQASALGLRPGAEAELTTIKLPSGARFTVASKVAPQFQAFLSELESSGYKINPEKSGGYNDRNIRGSEKKSQHAFGNAIDLNWDINPQGQSKHDLPSGINDIAAKHGIVWGGKFSNPDPMHFEVAALEAGQPYSGGDSSPASASSPTRSAATSPKEGEMLNFLSALGGSGNIMGGLGKVMGSQPMQAAGGSDNIFGSLAAMFGGGGGEGGGAASGAPERAGNAAEANMKLAQGAQQAAAGGQSQGPQAYQRKPVDLSNLMKILQQRSQMGVGGRQPGPGLGA